MTAEPKTAPATTPAAPVAEAPAKTPAVSARQLTSKFFESYGVKPKEEPKADPVPAKVEPKVEKPKAEKPAKPKDEFDPSLPTPPVKSRAVDSDEIKQIVSAAVSGAMEGQRPKAAPVVKDELPKGIARKIELLTVLEKDNPALAQAKVKISEFHRKGGTEEKYREEWTKANPGKKFDKEDEAHDEFYATDPVLQVQEDDWEEARDRRSMTIAREEAEKATSSTMSKRQQQEAQTSAVKTAHTALDQMALESVAGLSAELAEKAKTPEKLKTLDADDPVAEYVIKDTINRYAGATEATIEVFNGVPFDDKNPTHKAVSDLGVELEDRIMQIPEAKRRRGNLQFVTIEQSMKMTAKDRSKHWTIGQQELLNYIGSRIKSESKGLYDKLKGSSQVLKSGLAETNGHTEKPSEEAVAAVVSDSPSVGASSSAPPPGTKASTDAPRKGAAFFKSFGVS